MPPPEPASPGPLALGALALAQLLRRAGRGRPAAGAGRGREFEILPPPDHDRPAGAMLADLARSGAVEPVPGPRLLGGDAGAAFGRSIRIDAGEISYRDFAGGAWAEAHASRLENIYPGIRAIPSKESL